MTTKKRGDIFFNSVSPIMNPFRKPFERPVPHGHTRFYRKHVRLAFDGALLD